MATVVETTALLATRPSRGATSRAPKFSDTLQLTTSQVAKWSLRLVFVLMVARMLGPARFGVYALLFAVVEFLAVASGSGYADYLTRETGKDAHAGWNLAYRLTLLRTAIAVPAAALAVGALALLHYSHPVLFGTAFLSLSLAPRAFTDAVQGCLRGVRRFYEYLMIELILGASLVMGAGLVSLRHGALPMVIAVEIAASVAASIGAMALGVKHGARPTSWMMGAHSLRRSAIFNLYSLIGNLYDRVDVVLIFKLAGEYSAGIYSVAYRALGMTQIPAYGLLYSLLPGLSANPGGNQERRRLESAMGLLLSASFAVVLAVMVFAGPAVRLVLGERYAESASVLRILVWAVVFRYVNCGLQIALLAAAREAVFVRTTLTCLTFNLIGNLLLVPRYSWRAAAAMTVATEVVLLAQNLYWVRRTFGTAILPRGIVKCSLAFVPLLGISLEGQHLGLPFVCGAICLAILLAYLFRSGNLPESAAIWGGERASKSSLPEPNGLRAGSTLAYFRALRASLRDVTD